jgi:hypothetical protein
MCFGQAPVAPIFVPTKSNDMKNPASITCLKNAVMTALLLLLPVSFLFSQRTLPFGLMKKNAVFVSPVEALGKKKEILFGYERMLNDRNALRFHFGAALKNPDPNYETRRLETLMESEYRECTSETIWFLFFPVEHSSNCSSPHSDIRVRKEETYQTGHTYAGGSYRFYFSPFYKSKIINGLYIEPGFRAGRRTFSHYTFVSGDSTAVSTVTSQTEIAGLPFILVGTTGSSRVQKIETYRVESVKKSTYASSYLQPTLVAGFQASLGNAISLDFGGQISVKNARLKFSPALTAGVWF